MTHKIISFYSPTIILPAEGKAAKLSKNEERDVQIGERARGGKPKTDHPLLIQIQDMLHKIDVNQEETVVWVPGHVGIRGRAPNDAQSARL